MLFVFMSQPDFACNPHALWSYIRANTDYETGWIVKKENRLEGLRKRGVRCALYDTLAARQLLEKADYVIMNSYTFMELPKKKNQIFVNLWHGSGIKAHDYFDHNLNAKQAKKLQAFFDKTDLLCVHSLDDRFRLSAMLHFDLRKCYVTGQPRLDCVRKSNGKEKMVRLFGEKILTFDHLVFFAPSFRANMSTHSGKFCSDNIFRLDDYDDTRLKEFLEENNTALIYKLHPIEQTAFSGREFIMNPYCFELTDEMLFEADIRYDDLLNAFDVMMSDYSSIAFDFLVLDRPIVYLIPDYEEYKEAKGFVFRNVDYYMPGPKVYCFAEMLTALGDALNAPKAYVEERENVRMHRFDYLDDKSAMRCFETIMNYKPLQENYEPYVSPRRLRMPSSAEQLQAFVQDEEVLIIDSTKEVACHEDLLGRCRAAKKVFYITGEIPNEYRKLSSRNSYRIADLAFYEKIKQEPNVQITLVEGGVDYEKFSCSTSAEKHDSVRLGFAGTIDNRIYFAMVQFLCESFPDYEIVFAGDIMGDYPAWLFGYENLHYIEASYEELPAVIQSFDVAILPFFMAHKDTIPTELFQYLACGKLVVASDMSRLPKCDAIYISKSVSDCVEQVRKALACKEEAGIIETARETARQYDWKRIVEQIMGI